MEALIVESVTKTYEGSDFYLDHVSFSVPEGTIMGFVGENGAGKTTTMGCILNTLQYDSGNIEVLGQTMSDANTALREEIGVVYDSDNFPEHFTVAQLERVMQDVYRRWDNALFQRLIEQFHLDKTKKIGTYSRGMTMKLAIAVALAHHPRLLILDEATSGLDPVVREEILDLFLNFVGDEKHAILLSSHITSDLARIADYMTFIHNGKIILTERKDSLLYQYGILRCRKSQVAEIDPEDVLAMRPQDYQTSILVKDRALAEKKYPHVVIDAPSIDEIMLLLVKGEAR